MIFPPVGHSSGGYQIPNSLRFRASASAYLSSTPGVAPTSTTTKTWSGWVKRGQLGSSFYGALWCGLLSEGVSYSLLQFTQDALTFHHVYSSATAWLKTTTQLFRDPTAWYHIIAVMDTNNATADERIRLYVNGVRVTAFSSSTNPSSGASSYFQTNGVTQRIGRYATASPSYFDGYLAEVHVIDGQALTPSDFGETNADGVWVPKKYTGTYGNNGFYLDFKDATSTTTLGYDAAGSNDWTCNNISLTAGVTYDWMTDTPTINYCTLNPLDKGGSVNPSNANLTFANTVATYNIVRSGVGMTTGKWYVEYTIVASSGIASGRANVGLHRYDAAVAGKYLGQDTNSCGSLTNATPPVFYYNGTSKALSSGLGGFVAGDVIQYAYDADAGKLWVGVKNAWDGGNDPSTGSTPTLSSGFSGSSGPWFFAAHGYTSPDEVAINFGQRPFAYTPPTGFKALCTANMPAVTVPNPRKHFDVKTRSGTSATTQTQTGVEFAPEFVWIKPRNLAYNHNLFDILRGVGKTLRSDGTVGDQTNDNNGYLSAFNSDGYTLTNGATSGDLVKGNTYTYVDWLWKANGAGVSNTDGTITSTVSANRTAGFSIVTYTGTGANATVGHGLGVAPKMVIVKQRTTGTVENWAVYNANLANTEYLLLNGTAAKATDTTYWNSATPSSTVFSIGSAADTNESAKDFVAYCFAEIPGYSKFGSVTCNATTDNAFVFTGISGGLLLIKCSSTTGNWVMIDATRQTYNVEGPVILSNSSGAESAQTYLDFTAGGFKIRSSGADVGAAQTYIYAHIGGTPFGGSNVSQSPAR